MLRASLTTLALVTASLSLTNSAFAQESNRNTVRSNLSKDGWSVVWGKNFTEADWARGTLAIAESVAAENPGPFLKWFGETVDENFSKIERNLKDVSKRDLQNWVVQSLKSKKIIRYKNFRIEAGFATYNRWKRVVYDEPRTRQVKKSLPFGGWTYVPEVYTARVEKQIPLPNWHQFYLRYQLVSGNTNSGGSSNNPPTTSNSNSRINYSLWNDTRSTVKFRLPSGRTYSLGAGQRGSYYFTGSTSNFKIHVLNTGKTYTLAGGRHKFWWMRTENRVAFDRNYQ